MPGGLALDSKLYNVAEAWAPLCKWKALTIYFSFNTSKEAHGDNYLLKGTWPCWTWHLFYLPLKTVKIAQLIICTSNLLLLGDYHKEIVILINDQIWMLAQNRLHFCFGLVIFKGKQRNRELLWLYHGFRDMVAQTWSTLMSSCCAGRRSRGHGRPPTWC